MLCSFLRRNLEDFSIIVVVVSASQSFKESFCSHRQHEALRKPRGRDGRGAAKEKDLEACPHRRSVWRQNDRTNQVN